MVAAYTSQSVAESDFQSGCRLLSGEAIHDTMAALLKYPMMRKRILHEAFSSRASLVLAPANRSESGSEGECASSDSTYCQNRLLKREHLATTSFFGFLTSYLVLQFCTSYFAISGRNL